MRICFDSIYNSAIGRISCCAQAPFHIEFTGEFKLVYLEVGSQLNTKSLESVHLNGKYILEFECIGLVQERKFKKQFEGSTVGSYGMQYYPYISSVIGIQLTSYQSIIENITIALPDEYRVIWFEEKVCRDKVKSEKWHSHGENKSTYIFSWQVDSQDPNCSEICTYIPVRIGGKQEITYHYIPTIYFFLVLPVLALLALQDNVYVLISAVAGSGIFLLNNLISNKVPQKNTIMFGLFYTNILLLIVWSLLWFVYAYKALFWLLPIAIYSTILFYNNKKFNREGILSPTVEQFFFKKRYKHELKLKSKAKRN